MRGVRAAEPSLGLAPSAVAASLLRDQTGDATTIAKSSGTWNTAAAARLTGRSDPDTLVIIDEAGMADTISLATVIDHVVGRGGSVRLVGDDQQLAAISAGGVLRDIAEIHGAVELNELLRFQDPAEANASLALRDGRPEALGFYLDEDRIHAGTQESSLEAAFNDWARDRAAGLDSLMLAGTRDTVTDLNRRARAHRLTTHDGAAGEERRWGWWMRTGPRPVMSSSPASTIADLAISATDWVKNGDRWIVQHVTNRGVVQGQALRLRADGDLAAGLRRQVRAARLRRDRARRPGPHGGRHPRCADRGRDQAAALRHGHPRPPRQPPVRARRR